MDVAAAARSSPSKVNKQQQPPCSRFLVAFFLGSKLQRVESAFAKSDSKCAQIESAEAIAKENENRFGHKSRLACLVTSIQLQTLCQKWKEKAFYEH